MKSAIPFGLLLLLTVCSAASAQTGRLRQVKKNPVIQKKASDAAITTFVAFFEYVKKYEPDIVGDVKAQEKWLTKSLRKNMMDLNNAWDVHMSKNPDHKPEHPNNSSFLGVWNQPTTYSIVSARQYDYRNKDNPNAFRTVIDVFYEWGDEKDICNQYPGVRNLHSFMFVFEDGAWKLDDIYIFNDEFTTSDSLRQSFRAHPPQD